MTDTLVIALAQMTQSVGNMAYNADAMLAWRARAEGADLIVFPELALIGCPAEDLVLKPAFVDRANEELDRLAQATADGGPAMLVGTVVAAQGVLFNSIALLENGAVTQIRLKRELPNHGVFDEKRLFAPGPLPEPVPFRGVQLGVALGEDISFPFVTAHLKAQGAEILLCPSASPFEIARGDHRMIGIATTRLRETGLPLIWLNRIGGQDELVFDGGSFVMNGDEAVAHRLPGWEEALVLTQWEKRDGQWACVPGELHAPDDQAADIYQAMMVGLRDHVDRNGHAGVLIDLTGGIGAALSAAVAVDALGAERVRCLLLSPDDAGGARICAERLGVACDEVPLGAATAALAAVLGPGALNDLGGLALRALGAGSGSMPIDSRDKTALSLGLGEPCGAFSVVADVYETTVRDLVQWRNANQPARGRGPAGPIITEQPLGVAAEADLPSHELLDPILYGMVEEDLSVDQLVARGFERNVLAEVERRLYAAEAARHRSPPGVKIGTRSFGRDRRYPITHAFRTL